MQNLSKTELTRYSRNILLPEVGKEGQLKLKNARVSVVGAGGLGSPVLLYLAAAGIGHLTIIDSDTVDLTNLQRQVLYQSDSVGRKKASEAEARIHQINPHLDLSVFDRRLTPETVSEMLSSSDLVIEGSDNFMTKFLVNDFCFYADKPLILAGIHQFEGQIVFMHPGKTFCYRCIFHSPPPAEETPSCSESGVLGSIAGIAGSIQASECLKHFLGMETILGNILFFDAKTMEFRKRKFSQNPECILCGKKNLKDYSWWTEDICRD